MERAIDSEMRDGMLAFASKMQRIQEHILLESGIGLTYRNFRGLQRISSGHNTLTNLGTLSTITYSALSQSIASLISKGYITRRRGVDRREAVLAVTPAGTEVMEAAAARYDDFIGELCGGLTGSDIEHFRRILFRLLDNLDAIAVENGLRPAQRARRNSSGQAVEVGID